jgi:hypothetical protein
VCDLRVVVDWGAELPDSEREGAVVRMGDSERSALTTREVPEEGRLTTAEMARRAEQCPARTDEAIVGKFYREFGARIGQAMKF